MKWFQLDSDTPNDPKIRAVLDRFGNAGFGALVRLWCFIASQGKRPGQSVGSSGRKIPKAYLIAATGLTESDFDLLLSELLQNGHIAEQRWEKNGIVDLPAMRRRADTYTRRKFEHSSNNVRVQDNTVQDKVHKYSARSRARSFGPPKTKKSHDPYRVILKLVHEVIHETPRSQRSFANLTEPVKARCAQCQIPYDAEVIRRALESALSTPEKWRHA
jgi:hypothetical protein